MAWEVLQVSDYGSILSPEKGFITEYKDFLNSESVGRPDHNKSALTTFYHLLSPSRRLDLDLTHSF